MIVLFCFQNVPPLLAHLWCPHWQFFPLSSIFLLLLIFFSFILLLLQFICLSPGLPSHHPHHPSFSSLSPCHSSGCTKQGLDVIEVLTWEFFHQGLLSFAAPPERDLSLLGFSSSLGLASPRTPHGNSLSSCLCALSPVALVPFPDRCVPRPWWSFLPASLKLCFFYYPKREALPLNV